MRTSIKSRKGPQIFPYVGRKERGNYADQEKNRKIKKSPSVFPHGKTDGLVSIVGPSFFPRGGKHADGVPFFTGSADFIWESALHFMLRTCGLLSGKKNLPLDNPECLIALFCRPRYVPS
jgi:hypothetical protein